MEYLTLSDTSTLTLKNMQAHSCRYTLLYVYPKDNTPGCTQQSLDFSERYKDFLDLGIEVLGISKDSIESHIKFKAKYNFSQQLISDQELVFLKELGAYGEKNNYGKKTLGVIRSTFIIDRNNYKVVQYWRNVRAKGHVDKVLREINVDK